MARFFSPFYSLTSYSDWATSSWKKTLLWVLVFTTLVGCISTAEWFRYWRQELQANLQTETSALLDHYPPDLVLKWDGQQLSSSEPLTVPWPPSLESAKAALETQTQTPAPTDWINLDTAATTSAETPALLKFNSQDLVVTLHPEAPFTFPLDILLNEIQPMEVTYQNRVEFALILNKLIDDKLEIITFQLPIAATLIQLIVTLWVGLTNAVIIYFFTRLMGRTYHFGSLAKLSLIVTTVSFTLFALATLAVPTIEYWWHEFSYWVIMTLVLWQLKPTN